MLIRGLQSNTVRATSALLDRPGLASFLRGLCARANGLVSLRFATSTTGIGPSFRVVDHVSKMLASPLNHRSNDTDAFIRQEDPDRTAESTNSCGSVSTLGEMMSNLREKKHPTACRVTVVGTVQTVTLTPRTTYTITPSETGSM